MNRVKKAGSDLINRSSSKNRRSWVEDSRMSQSQSQSQLITSESPENGKSATANENESDNSNEEPLSIASDTSLMNRGSPVRQSMTNRKTSEQISQVLMRGNMRGSQQSIKREDQTNRNSYQG